MSSDYFPVSLSFFFINLISIFLSFFLLNVFVRCQPFLIFSLFNYLFIIFARSYNGCSCFLNNVKELFIYYYPQPFSWPEKWKLYGHLDPTSAAILPKSGTSGGGKDTVVQGREGQSWQTKFYVAPKVRQWSCWCGFPQQHSYAPYLKLKASAYLFSIVFLDLFRIVPFCIFFFCFVSYTYYRYLLSLHLCPPPPSPHPPPLAFTTLLSLSRGCAYMFFG